MIRSVVALTFAGLLATTLVGCGGDGGQIRIAGADTAATVGRTASDGLSAAAAELVRTTAEEHHIVPTCTVDEAARLFVERQDEPLPSIEAIVNAYVSRDCSPCFSLALIEQRRHADSDAGTHADLDREIITASVPDGLADSMITGDAATGPVATEWSTRCRSWMKKVTAAATSYEPSTTARPPDGPDEQSYGDTEGLFGEIGGITSHPDAGPAPRVLWHQDIGAEAMILHDGIVYVADISAGVTAIDVTTGDIRWQVQPDEGADTSGGSTLSFVDGHVRVFVPYSYAVELDAVTGATISLRNGLRGNNPWPEQAWWYTAEDGDFHQLEGWEPRVEAFDDDFRVAGRTADGTVSFETTGGAMVNPLPYGLRLGSTVVIADQSGYVVGLDWP